MSTAGVMHSISRTDIPIALRKPRFWLFIAAFVALPFTPLGFLATEILIFAIAAAGFDLLIGYTGYVSFGQAMFFGIGAYIAGYAAMFLGLSFLPALLLAGIAGIILGLIVGFLSFRRRGVYFALLTLAFAQMIWVVFSIQTSWSGGPQGLTISRPDILFGPVQISTAGNIPMYVITLVIAALLFVFADNFIHSNFGQVIKGINHNEDRIEYLGYNKRIYKIVTFSLSGFYVAIAGGLLAFSTEFAFPDFFFWTITGDLLMMVLIGGMGSLYGPVIGAFIFVGLRDYLSILTDRWPLVLGVIFVFVVLLLPGGLISAFNRVKTDSRNLSDRIKLP